MGEAPRVVHNAGARRFEAVVDGLLCRADYTREGDTLRMHHTGVPPELEGRGIASVLVRAAFEHAAAEGLTIEPACAYVHAWSRRHKEFAHLLARQ